MSQSKPELFWERYPHLFLAASEPFEGLPHHAGHGEPRTFRGSRREKLYFERGDNGMEDVNTRYALARCVRERKDAGICGHRSRKGQKTSDGAEAILP